MKNTVYEQILYSVKNEILTITLNRPERLNAWTRDVMLRECLDAFDRADADDDIRAIIVTGAGRAFCAGVDLTVSYENPDENAAFNAARDRDTGGQIALRIFNCMKPVIAAINGPAVGVGITMTLPMDIRIAADITYIPMERGFCYLVAVMDWASQMVLSWRLSNTLDSAFCADALEEAITTYGCPDIFNTDQGSQFTSEAFTDILRSHDISISMDGKGRWMDNVFIERPWKSVKYEDIYLKAYNSMKELKKGLADYCQFYNEKRWHNTFDRKTPAMVYCESLPQGQAAA